MRIQSHHFRVPPATRCVSSLCSFPAALRTVRDRVTLPSIVQANEFGVKRRRAIMAGLSANRKRSWDSFCFAVLSEASERKTTIFRSSKLNLRRINPPEEFDPRRPSCTPVCQADAIPRALETMLTSLAIRYALTPMSRHALDLGETTIHK